MSATIYEFKRREEKTESEDLSTLDLFTKLDKLSQSDFQRTVKTFQRFGWTPTADKLAARISGDLRAIAALVAGTRNGEKRTEDKTEG